MLLAVETSTRTGSVALVDGQGRVVAHRALDANSDNGGLLAPAVASLPGLDLATLDGYAVGIGPGSFTGLRIALAFVKGLALAYPRPAIAVPTLEVIAAGIFEAHPEATSAVALLDARRREVYAALYHRTSAGLDVDPALPVGAYAIERVAPIVRTLVDGSCLGARGPVIAAGDGVALDHGADAPWTIAERALWIPDARVLARLALPRLAAGLGVDAIDLEPAYHQLTPVELAEQGLA
ncbi:tRNA (adenosine(37)-N6)-threonylcarbamoyltransferase complex dimerization subunit type 1 TsaB [Myxococcota bacterium]|nr:tRNA (adenosine(37)-N6)-threonylcarbamoyltransferase complex dimerization subunit type 1 TsaB [Myxococcota bacterium]